MEPTIPETKKLQDFKLKYSETFRDTELQQMGPSRAFAKDLPEPEELE